MTYGRLPNGPMRLRSDEFRLLRDLVNARTGMQFGDESLILFDRRLSERVTALGLAGFDEYYRYLRLSAGGSAELDEVVERLITSETYFFRQEYQLRAFRDEVLPILYRENLTKRRLTLWSAGCSTGEEAYTLAILVQQSGRFASWDVRVIGSDISKQNVIAARKGVYRSASFRTTSPEARRAYFTEQGGLARVTDSVRTLCHFGRLNLLDSGSASVVGRVDAVFCRNVLIYLDVRSRRQVIDNLYERLTPGGFLMLGHSESLLNITTAFELVHLSEDLVYRKPLSTVQSGEAG